MSCLVDHRGNISDYHCKQYVTKMTTIIFSDFRLICGFMDSCRDDINALRCGSISMGEKVKNKKTTSTTAERFGIVPDTFWPVQVLRALKPPNCEDEHGSTKPLKPIRHAAIMGCLFSTGRATVYRRHSGTMRKPRLTW